MKRSNPRIVGVGNRVGLVLTVATIVAAGCSSSGEGPPPEPPVASAAPTTTVAVVSTVTTTVPVTEPSTTTAAPTSQAPSTDATTVPSTDVVPSTTEPFELLSEEAVTAVIIARYEAWTTCLNQLPNCDIEAAVSYYPPGDLRQVVFDQAEGANADGITVTNTESRRIIMDSVVLNLDNGTATAFGCEENPSFLFNADGVLFNDLFDSRRREWSLEVVGSEWLIVTAIDTSVAVGEEVSVCR